MSKSILIVLLVVLLAGGGVVFAEFGPEVGFVGVNAELVDDEEEENNDERSNVSAAVHVYLSGDENITPGDKGFGPAVAERAKDKDINLGQEVSEAAREANSSEDIENGNDDSNNNGDDVDERSEVAKAVHKALTADPENGDNNGLEPGDEDFGQTVADQAKDINLGQEVSKAAREANSSAARGNGNSNAAATGRP